MSNFMKDIISVIENAKGTDRYYKGYDMLYRLLKSGELGAFRIGRIWKVPRKELDKYIDKSVERMLSK